MKTSQSSTIPLGSSGAPAHTDPLAGARMPRQSCLSRPGHNSLSPHILSFKSLVGCLIVAAGSLKVSNVQASGLTQHRWTARWGDPNWVSVEQAGNPANRTYMSYPQFFQWVKQNGANHPNEIGVKVIGSLPPQHQQGMSLAAPAPQAITQHQPHATSTPGYQPDPRAAHLKQWNEYCAHLWKVHYAQQAAVQRAHYEAQQRAAYEQQMAAYNAHQAQLHAQQQAQLARAQAEANAKAWAQYNAYQNKLRADLAAQQSAQLQAEQTAAAQANARAWADFNARQAQAGGQRAQAHQTQIPGPSKTGVLLANLGTSFKGILSNLNRRSTSGANHPQHASERTSTRESASAAPDKTPSRRSTAHTPPMHTSNVAPTKRDKPNKLVKALGSGPSGQSASRQSPPPPKIESRRSSNQGTLPPPTADLNLPQVITSDHEGASLLLPPVPTE